jgi:hypothetical protein
MKNEIYSYWYKHPSQLINTPSMSLMINKEGIEALEDIKNMMLMIYA